MTDYVKSTNFASKDSLAVGNPLKIVKGTEIDAEFNNIAIAVTSKADLNSPVLIGVPTAPTASSGANTTQLATTAFVTAALQAMYPVGSIYTNAGVTTNPGTLLGFGTWVAFGAGRVMVGLDGADALFDALEETGGSKDATLVSHSHTATSTVNDSGHSHIPSSNGNTTGFATDGFTYNVARASLDGGPNTSMRTSTETTGISVSTSIGSSGSSATNANLQPYITVAMWKRTA